MAKQQKTKHYASMSKRTWGQILRGTGIGFTMIYEDYRDKVLQDQPHLSDAEIIHMYKQETWRLTAEMVIADVRSSFMKKGLIPDLTAGMFWAGIILAVSMAFSVQPEHSSMPDVLANRVCSAFKC